MLQEIGVQMYKSGKHCAACMSCASILDSPSSFTFQHSPSSEAETKCHYVSCDLPLWKWFGQYICDCHRAACRRAREPPEWRDECVGPPRLVEWSRLGVGKILFRLVTHPSSLYPR